MTEKISKDKLELDSSTKEFLNVFTRVFSSIADLSIPEQRAAIKKMFCVPKDQLESVAHIKDIQVPGRNGSINVRLFTPKNDGKMPVIVYFHRGGWVYGSLDESESICRRLANETGAIVADVEYRLSPEHSFPVPLEDCYDASKWIVKNADTFQGDPNKVIVSGESAGGNLAAAVTLMARDTKEFSVAGQLLMYPCLTNELIMEYYEQSPDKFLLSLDNMRFFLNAYLPSSLDGENPYASPLKSTIFTDLPTCFMITAEQDALKHEGAQYAEELKKAGVEVKSKCYPGVIHGFLDLPLADETKNAAMKDIAIWVKDLP